MTKQQKIQKAAFIVIVIMCILFTVVGLLFDPKNTFSIFKNIKEWSEPFFYTYGLPGLILAFVLSHVKHSGVSIVVLKGGKEVARKSLGKKKAMEIAEDDVERGVVLKGQASPFGWLNVDVEEITFYDEESRTWFIDMDKNPPSAPRASEAELVLEVLKSVGLLEKDLDIPGVVFKARKALVAEKERQAAERAAAKAAKEVKEKAEAKKEETSEKKAD